MLAERFEKAGIDLAGDVLDAAEAGAAVGVGAAWRHSRWSQVGLGGSMGCCRAL